MLLFLFQALGIYSTLGECKENIPVRDIKKGVGDTNNSI